MTDEDPFNLTGCTCAFDICPDVGGDTATWDPQCPRHPAIEDLQASCDRMAETLFGGWIQALRPH